MSTFCYIRYQYEMWKTFWFKSFKNTKMEYLFSRTLQKWWTFLLLAPLLMDWFRYSVYDLRLRLNALTKLRNRCQTYKQNFQHLDDLLLNDFFKIQTHIRWHGWDHNDDHLKKTNKFSSKTIFVWIILPIYSHDKI